MARAFAEGVKWALKQAEPVVDRVGMSLSDVLRRIPELQASAQRLLSGEGSREEHARLVRRYKPVAPYKTVPRPASRDEILAALTSDKLPRVGQASASLKRGDPVALRLDIPAYSRHGTWVVSAHEPKADFAAGRSIGYEPVASVKNVSFGVVPKAALNIAAGKPKATIATMKGSWEPTEADMAFLRAQEALDHPDWVQVGMDPERHSYFYDRATMRPVTEAEEALQIGPLVLAKKPRYGDPEDFPFKDGGLAAKPVWEKKRPKDLGKPKSLSVKKKKSAKARAKAAGRPYPNLVDNMAAAKKKGK